MQLPEDVRNACEISEAKAWADSVRGVAEREGNPLGAEVHYVGSGCVPVVAGIDSHLINRVIGLGVQTPATEGDIDRVLTLYRERGQRSFAISLAPNASPAALREWLAKRRLEHSSTFAKVWRRAGRAPDLHTNLRIEAVGAERAVAFASVNCAAWRVPPAFLPWFEGGVGRDRWRHYLAFDGLNPVATGALFVIEGIGWLGFAATLPSHRNRGAHSALLARRIRDATQLGCEIVVTETLEETRRRPNPSYRNMLRVGFELAYLRPNYTPANPE